MGRDDVCQIVAFLVDTRKSCEHIPNSIHSWCHGLRQTTHNETNKGDRTPKIQGNRRGTSCEKFRRVGMSVPNVTKRLSRH